MNRTRSSKPRRPSNLAAAILMASLAVAACGSSSSPTILNTEKVERAIERSALAQRGERAAVSCPSGVHQTKGLVFACTAVVGRATTRFVVTELNGSGDVHYVAR
jgi:Domain of unknown function (DUF4333)